MGTKFYALVSLIFGLSMAHPTTAHGLVSKAAPTKGSSGSGGGSGGGGGGSSSSSTKSSTDDLSTSKELTGSGGSSISVDDTKSITLSNWYLYWDLKAGVGSFLSQDGTKERVYVGQGMCGCKSSEFTYLHGETKDLYPDIYCYKEEGDSSTKVLYETLASGFESLGKQADECFGEYRNSLSYNFGGTCGCPKAAGMTPSIGIDGIVTCTGNDGVTSLKRYDGMAVHSGFKDDGGSCDSENSTCSFEDNCIDGAKKTSVTSSLGATVVPVHVSVCPSGINLFSRKVTLSLDMSACRNAIYGKVTLPETASVLTPDDIVISDSGCTIKGSAVTSSGKSCYKIKSLLSAHSSAISDALAESEEEDEKEVSKGRKGRSGKDREAASVSESSSSEEESSSGSGFSKPLLKVSGIKKSLKSALEPSALKK